MWSINIFVQLESIFEWRKYLSFLEFWKDATLMDSKFSNHVKFLGFILFDKLLFSKQISSVTSTCYYMLWRIYSIKETVDRVVLIELVRVIIISRLYYWNLLYYGLPAVLHGMLQRIMNCASSLIFRLSPGTPTSRFIKQLQWLPVQKSVCSKFCFLVIAQFIILSEFQGILALLCLAMIKLQDGSIFTILGIRSLKLTSEKGLSAMQFRTNGTDCHLN